MRDFHSFAQGGQNFLFFPRSARLYQLSEVASGILSELYRGSTAVSIPARRLPPPRFLSAEEAGVYSELCDLLHRELAVPPPLARRPDPSFALNGFQTFSIYLAQTCNMACCYCWNRGGTFGRAGHLMGKKAARRVVKMILSLLDSSTADRTFINFYGGEPLLDFDVLKEITLELLQDEERLARKIFFTLDTNGTLLQGEIADFLARHFTQIGVSIDGCSDIHDLQRPGKYGENTWQRIADNIRNFPNPGILGLRGTLTAFSHSYRETFLELTALGVGRIQLEYCHEPGFHVNPIYEKLLVPPERQLAELMEFVEYYVDWISGYRETREIPFLSNILDGITRIRRGSRFTRPCGAGTNTLAVNSRGAVFPCIAFVDREQFVMGEAEAGRLLTLHRTLAEFEVDAQLPCRSCWLRYDCAGGCYATHYDMTGHTRHPHPDYCRNMRGKAEIFFYGLGKMLEKCPWHLKDAPSSPPL